MERLQKPSAAASAAPSAGPTPLVHLQVPPGMDAALRGLTREVLRRQPSDLYLFAHRYFESLLAARVGKFYLHPELIRVHLAPISYMPMYVKIQSNSFFNIQKLSKC